ncbi:MAG: hypothetical protein Hyperionvirus7_59 [Hyperionvirus sp.]|uniref:Methyltransferase FkbM domain-containing protein n=1 Tax=Hyperionvirus sp. TaxID=2487770 RepID=A0A3G5A8D1_9VIRU|nr:MAG: hypothetical protein Hyperionvirus7_59 [Hyperionvirus sp.]
MNKFDWNFYLHKYADLSRAGINTKTKAYHHWITYGKKEGRVCTFSDREIYEDKFDWEYYVQRYSDLVKRGINTKEKAYNHWIIHGKNEGRQVNLTKEIEEKYQKILRRNANLDEINYFVMELLNKKITLSDVDEILKQSLEKKYLRLLRQLVVYDISDYRKIRLGNDHDGGYIVIYHLSDIEKIYSYGVGDNISFEKDLFERCQCPVYLYDPTVEIHQLPNQNFIFKKEGVYDKKTDDMDTLWSHIKQNNDETNNHLFLKMDIENAEWCVIQEVAENILSLFEQIVIEIHWLDRIESVDLKIAVLKKINKYFYLVHAHANNYVEVVIINGLKIPRVIELTFIRKDLVQNVNISTQKFPTLLDSVNDPSKPEINLDFYPFDPITRTGALKKY